MNCRRGTAIRSTRSCHGQPDAAVRPDDVPAVLEPRIECRGHGPGAENGNAQDNQLRQKGLPPGDDLLQPLRRRRGIVGLDDQAGPHEVKPGNGQSGTDDAFRDDLRIGKAIEKPGVRREIQQERLLRCRSQASPSKMERMRRGNHVRARKMTILRAMEGSSPLTTFNFCISLYAGPPRSKKR